MAAGDLVGDLSLTISNPTGLEIYKLLLNPDNLFSISGSHLIETNNIPIGIYTISIEVFGPNIFKTQTFIIDYLGSPALNVLIDVDGNILTDVDGNILMASA